MLFQVGKGNSNVIVDVSLDISAGVILQALLKVPNCSWKLSIFIICQSSAIVNERILLVYCKGIRKVTDPFLIFIKFKINSASLD